MIKETITLAIIFFTLMSSSGCDRQKEIQPSGKIIKLGIIGPFSGEDKAKGLEGIKGVETAMALTPLLDNGDKIQLIIEDDKNKPALTLSTLQRLVAEEQVSAIILMSTSASALEIKYSSNELQIPILAMLATHPDITKDSGFISQLCFDNHTQAAVAALFVMDELLLNKVAIFTSPDSRHSTALATEFINKYQSVGGGVVDTVLIEPDIDYEKELVALREKGTELLYLPVKPKEMVTIVKAADELNWQPKVMGSDGLLATVISDYSSDTDYLDGIYAIDYFASNDNPIEHKSRLEKISKIYKASHKHESTSYTALGFESFAVLQNAMNRCEVTNNSACINDRLRDTEQFEGLAGKISINEDGKASRPLVVNSIKDGKMKFIVKVY